MSQSLHDAGKNRASRSIAPDGPLYGEFPSALAVAELTGVLDPNERLTRAKIHKAIARLCIEAHAAGMRCEDLIINLKKIWARIPQASAYRLWNEKSGDDGDLLSRVVSECIDEFYRSASTNGPAGTATP